VSAEVKKSLRQMKMYSYVSCWCYMHL